MIYDDSLAADWEDWSWDAIVDLNNVSPTYGGSARSISVDYTAAWGVFSLRRSSPLDMTGYDRIVLKIHGGASGTGDLRFYIQTTDAGPDSPYVVVNVPAAVWTDVTVNLSDLGNPTQIARVNLMDAYVGDNPVFFVDLYTIACAAAPTATPTPTSTPSGGLVVNSTANGSDASPGDGICETAVAGECTLRAAIQEANALSGANTILFNIPGSPPFTIAPTSSLPSITGPVTIDGWSQPGWAGAPIIELNGASAGPGANGLGVQTGGSGSTIRGLVINRFDASGIYAPSGGDLVIQGNYIGTDLTGMLARPNNAGIYITGSSDNTIGGTLAAERNVVSGNTYEGLYLADVHDSTIQGNYIGTTASGAGATPNGAAGIYIEGTGNAVGGLAAGAGNRVAYNGLDGVVIDVDGSTPNAILGNSIYDNGALGIDLDDNGVSLNNGSLNPTRPNHDMDYAVFTSATLSGSTLTVAGYVGSAPNQSLFANARVEIFASDTDASGHGEGRTYLGFLTADAQGNFSGSLTVSGLSVGDSVTATATSGSGYTSEFGPNFVVASAPTPTPTATSTPTPTPTPTATATPTATPGLSASYWWYNVTTPLAYMMYSFPPSGTSTNSSSTVTFYSDTYAGGETVNAGTATVYLSAMSDLTACDIDLTLRGGTSILGTGTISVPASVGSPTLFSDSLALSSYTFSAGERLYVRVDLGSCFGVSVYWDGAYNTSRLVLP